MLANWQKILAVCQQQTALIQGSAEAYMNITLANFRVQLLKVVVRKRQMAK